MRFGLADGIICILIGICRCIMGTQPAEGIKPVSISYSLRRISIETGVTSVQPETRIPFALPDTSDNTISLCCLNVQSSLVGPKYGGLLRLFCLFIFFLILENHLPTEKLKGFSFIFFFPPVSRFHLKYFY